MILSLEMSAADEQALHGFDAVHLASSVLLLQRTGQPVRFLAWDRRLNQAAAQLGLATDSTAGSAP